MKKFSTIFLLGTLLILAACSKSDINEPVLQQAGEPLTKAEINEIIESTMKSTNSVFHWDDAEDFLVWSAAVQSDSIMTVGFQLEGMTNIEEKMHTIDLEDPSWKATKENLIDFIVAETNKAYPNANFQAEDLMVGKPETILPVLDIKIFNEAVISALRARPDVRYVDPIGYNPQEVASRSGLGCGLTPASSIPSQDFTTVSPSVKVPWNFYNMNIPQAWSTSTGDNITIALIDTGTSPNQSKLGSQFNSGQSQGRFIDRAGTYVSSWWPWANPDGPNDQCGHGTQMSGLLAAPRGSGGSSVGVAYNSNLLAIRGTGDVVILGYNESRGVADAVTLAGSRGDVRILSMSIGTIFWSNRIADAIYYAHGNGKMIFAAAGTSTWFTSWVGVVFPATMSQTVAVTGIKDGSPMVKCNTCHSGGAVDFVAVMERRNDNNRTSLTLALSGNQPAWVGGSSAATATTAGIAALVWGTNPSMSRSTVLQRLKDASSNYPSRDGQFGWGLIDAAQAVN